MIQLIQSFSAQIKEGIEIGVNSEIRKHQLPIYKILISGMGGSGIGGNFVAELIRDECTVPCMVKKSYDIPAWVDENTLVIISSYSGNTEETVHALNVILKTGAKLVCISSGGKIIAAAKQFDLDYILLPAGWPSPRACLGYSITVQLAVLQKMGLIGRTINENLKSSSDLIKFEQEEIKIKAQRIAQLLINKIPVIYSADRYEPISVRWRQQINENSKMLCWHHVIPEMNHNELVGWREKNEDLAVIFLRNKDDLKRNAVRMDFVKQVVSQYSQTIIEVYSKGQSVAEKSIYLTHLGDWVSLYLAQFKNVNASEIEVIDRLKEKLSIIEF